MFYTLLVLVLFSSFKDTLEGRVQDPNRIRTLINLINKYTVDHGEALKELSLNEIRRAMEYVSWGFNKSVDMNNVPRQVSDFFDVKKFMTNIILSVNHNGTTKWTTTTENYYWRRKWKDLAIPSSSVSISKSVDDSKSNERWIPNGRKYYDPDDFGLWTTTKDPFEDATPFKLNYEVIQLKNKNTNSKNNERDINNGKNWGSDKDGKGRGSSENVQRDKSDDWNKPNRKEKDNWDRPLKSGNGRGEKQENLKRDRNKSSSYLDRKTKDSGAKEFSNQFPSKKIKDSLEYYKRKKTKKTDYSDYGNEKKISKDSNAEFRMKAKDNWDRPSKHDDHGKSKDDNNKPLKIKWYTKKDDSWNNKARDDWDKPLKDSWETIKHGNRNKKVRDDGNKPLKDSWDTKKDRNRNKKSKDDWDKPLKDSWESKKDGNRNKKFRDDWDKPLKDSWETKNDENKIKKPKVDWDKPLKDSWDTKKEKNFNKQSKDDWDTPKKVDWGEAKETKEWKRPPKLKIADLMNERHYPTYDERPRHDKRNRAVGGHGRTPIPFIGKRGIYEEK